jgi:hypothetical protein
MASTSMTPGSGSAAGGSGERLTEAASSVVTQAERTVETKASDAMQQLGGTLQEVAGAIRTAGENLRDQQPQVSGFADTAARQVDRAAEYIQQHEPREVLDEAQAIARRQPALVLGGGLAVGLALGRLLRTASSTTSSRGYGLSGTDRYGTSGIGRYGGHGSDSMAGAGGSMRSGTTGSEWTGRQSTTGNAHRPTPDAATLRTDPGASVIASTSTVDIGSEIESGRTRGTTGG